VHYLVDTRDPHIVSARDGWYFAEMHASPSMILDASLGVGDPRLDSEAATAEGHDGQDAGLLSGKHLI
jgi:hypothetical protein